MFVILFYDIPKKNKKNNYIKIKKIGEQYLQRVQYSVFEGNLSEAVLFEMKLKLKEIVIKDIDSIIIYSFKSMHYSKKEILGLDKKDDIFF